MVSSASFCKLFQSYPPIVTVTEKCGATLEWLPAEINGYYLVAIAKSGSGKTYRAIYARENLPHVGLVELVDELSSPLFSQADETIKIVDEGLVIHTPRAGLWIGYGGWRINNLLKVAPAGVKVNSHD